MKTIWTLIVIVISAIVVTIGGFAIYISQNQKQVVDNILFDFNISGINFSSLLNPRIDVGITIKNKNKFFILFSDLFVKLYYNGDLIAQSTKKDNSLHILPANGELPFNHEITLTPNIVKIKQPIKIDYEIDVRIFGYKINTIKDSFTI